MRCLTERWAEPSKRRSASDEFHLRRTRWSSKTPTVRPGRQLQDRSPRATSPASAVTTMTPTDLKGSSATSTQRPARRSGPYVLRRQRLRLRSREVAVSGATISCFDEASVVKTIRESRTVSAGKAR
jgi:hypothetical protein